MTGLMLPALAKSINRARATVNEARVILGPDSQLTHAAEHNLRGMMATGKKLLARN